MQRLEFLTLMCECKSRRVYTLLMPIMLIGWKNISLGHASKVELSSPPTTSLSVQTFDFTRRTTTRQCRGVFLLYVWNEDANAHLLLIRLSQSSNYFAQTCTNLFTRMIDTVPREVQLTEPVQPMLFKPVNVSLGLNWAGNMSFSGAIRVGLFDLFISGHLQSVLGLVLAISFKYARIEFAYHVQDPQGWCCYYSRYRYIRCQFRQHW
jgi:hypothetical protein